MLAARNKLLTKNFLSLSFVQSINSLLQLLVIPFVITIIGADGFGVLAVAQVVMFYLSTLTEFGFNQTATRSIAISRDDHQKVSRLFFTVYATRLLLCVLAFIILVILVMILPADLFSSRVRALIRWSHRPDQVSVAGSYTIH